MALTTTFVQPLSQFIESGDQILRVETTEVDDPTVGVGTPIATFDRTIGGLAIGPKSDVDELLLTVPVGEPVRKVGGDEPGTIQRTTEWLIGVGNPLEMALRGPVNVFHRRQQLSEAPLIYDQDVRLPALVGPTAGLFVFEDGEIPPAGATYDLATPVDNILTVFRPMVEMYVAVDSRGFGQSIPTKRPTKAWSSRHDDSLAEDIVARTVVPVMGRRTAKVQMKAEDFAAGTTVDVTVGVIARILSPRTGIGNTAFAETLLSTPVSLAQGNNAEVELILNGTAVYLVVHSVRTGAASAQANFRISAAD